MNQRHNIRSSIHKRITVLSQFVLNKSKTCSTNNVVYDSRTNEFYESMTHKLSILFYGSFE